MSFTEVTSFNPCGRELVVRTAAGTAGISFVRQDIVRLRFCPDDRLNDEETNVVQDKLGSEDFQWAEADGTLNLETGKVKVVLQLNPLSLALFRPGDRKILSTPLADMAELNPSASVLRFVLEPDEKIYGLGQDPMANLNQRDRERRMWQEWGSRRRSGNAGIPCCLSNRGYGLLLNSSWPSRFAIGRAEMSEMPTSPEFAPAPWGWQERSGETDPDQLAIILDHDQMDVFMICRDSFAEILSGFAELIGYSPMLPKWAFGFMQCKNRYRTQAELLSVAREYRHRRIPCDALVIDWLWFKEFGDLEWFRENWPDPAGMLAELAGMGFHVLQAQHPFIEKNSRKYPEFKEKGYLNQAPEGARPTFDHSSPAARKAWWEAVRPLYVDGIRGYWTDMGELEQHWPGTVSWLGPREKVHNIYMTLWAKGLYEGQRKDFDQRVLTLARTTYSGLQRYGAVLWSGDIDGSWEVLRDQVVIGQGVGLSGQPYWCTDIGGFFTGESYSPELYVRWFQWGIFCPVLRTHGTRPGNEAWSFGSQAEEIIAGMIRLRYRLLPYLYSCARQAMEKGTPIMRAMCLDYGDDPVAVDQVTQYLFGPAILVAPVVLEGARSRTVYLPDGIWHDFWSGRKYSGRQWVDVCAPLSRIPLFIKGGSIIPMGPDMAYVDEKPLEKVEIHAYSGQKGVFTLYEDDGLTYGYEKGAYLKTPVTIDEQAQVTIGVPEGDRRLIPAGREYCPIAHSGQPANQAAAEPVQIILDHNLDHAGICAIHASVINPNHPKLHLEANLHLPDGWELNRESTASLAAEINEYACLKWQVVPSARALPLIHRAVVDFQISGGGKTLTQSRQLSWGSGCATRWSLAGNFDNSDGRGLDRALAVESDPDLPAYQENGQTISWCENVADEFNCFGYVAFPRPPVSPNIGSSASSGVCYGKCRIWSAKNTMGYIELTADPCIKIWLNGQEIYKNSTIVLKQKLEQPINLKKGWNHLLVKIAIFCEKPYSGREYGFSLAVVDEQGKIVEDLLYAR